MKLSQNSLLKADTYVRPVAESGILGPVHGSWVDLLLHHIRRVEGGFITDLDWHSSDGRLLSGMAMLALEAASDYLDEFFRDVPSTQILLNRIQNLRERIFTVETSREEWSFDEHPGQVDPGS